MPPEDRRSFVRKSLATSVSLTFSGLIRAGHGATVIPDVNSTLWATDSTEDLWNTTNFNMTFPNDSTQDPWSFFSGEDVSDPSTQCPHLWSDYINANYKHVCHWCNAEQY